MGGRDSEEAARLRPGVYEHGLNSQAFPMDPLHNPFKRALKSGKLQLGLWHSLSSHLVAEILADAGFDWILLDTEHAPNELPMVLAELQAMSGGTAHAVVRPAWNDPVIIKRLLDVGAQSLLIPYVETEEEARRAVMSVRYPPEGFRGFAGQARASRYGRIKGYHAAANAGICLLLQVETKRGLDNLEAIASVEGVDGVFIGPGDLSAALGYLGQPNHPDVIKIIDDMIPRIKNAGCAPGILTGDAELAQHYIDRGCLFAAVGSDIGLLARGADQLAAKFKGQNSGR
jgi:4-hydroxy-2-oxoheptanedioate aldolase